MNWQNAEVIVKMVISDENAVENTHKNIDNIIQQMRVRFDRQVIVSNGRSFREIMHHESKEADLVMLGLAEPDDQFLTYYENLSEKTLHLPPTVFVLAAQKLDLKKYCCEILSSFFVKASLKENDISEKYKGYQ